MNEHTGLPVEGYRPQPTAAVDLVNENKRLEEEVLRALDNASLSPEIDKRMLALARTNIEQGFMWFNRAIFKPSRVKLPGDA